MGKHKVVCVFNVIVLTDFLKLNSGVFGLDGRSHNLPIDDVGVSGASDAALRLFRVPFLSSATWHPAAAGCLTLGSDRGVMAIGKLQTLGSNRDVVVIGRLDINSKAAMAIILLNRQFGIRIWGGDITGDRHAKVCGHQYVRDLIIDREERISHYRKILRRAEEDSIEI